MDRGYWFNSDIFQIHKGEDEETNPGCFGKELAVWLGGKLKELGYETEEPIPEDWGWCVMCKRGDYLLWVGCGAMQTAEITDDHEPASPQTGTDVVWHVFPQIEIPAFYVKSLFRKLLGKLDTKTPLSTLNRDLSLILSSEPKITLCDEP